MWLTDWSQVFCRRSEKSSKNLEEEQQEVHRAPQHNVSTTSNHEIILTLNSWDISYYTEAKTLFTSIEWCSTERNEYKRQTSIIAAILFQIIEKKEKTVTTQHVTPRKVRAVSKMGGVLKCISHKLHNESPHTHTHVRIHTFLPVLPLWPSTLQKHLG